jgi:hypothetical protein
MLSLASISYYDDVTIRLRMDEQAMQEQSRAV